MLVQPNNNIDPGHENEGPNEENYKNDKKQNVNKEPKKRSKKVCKEEMFSRKNFEIAFQDIVFIFAVLLSGDARPMYAEFGSILKRVVNHAAATSATCDDGESIVVVNDLALFNVIKTKLFPYLNVGGPEEKCNYIKHIRTHLFSKLEIKKLPNINSIFEAMKEDLTIDAKDTTKLKQLIEHHLPPKDV